MGRQYETCKRCNGHGSCWWDARNGVDKKCRACDGARIVPVVVDWRPYEPSKDTP